MSSLKMDLTGKVAVVTGASRGIGKAIALDFARAGADIVATARTVDDIRETASEVEKLGRKALAVPADVCNINHLKNLYEQTMDTFRKIDILVNNAGGFSGGADYVHKETVENWLNAIDLNLNSIFYCCNILGQAMIKQRSGNVLNISSGMGFGAFPGVASHAAARAGVINFTQTLALEWAPFNIRVNSLAPGYTATDLPAREWKEHPEHLQELLKNVPVGRVAQPEEMSSVATFLVSDLSSYITGEIIYVSGGLFTPVPPSWYHYYQQQKQAKPVT